MSRSLVAWIGTGNMGVPMAKNLLKAGHNLIVYDLVKKNAEPVIKAGAKWANSATEAAKKSEFVFTMVPDGKALQEAIYGKAGVLTSLDPTKVVIDMSTVSPEESNECFIKISSKGSQFLRAPVSGGPPMAQAAKLGILCSGEKSTYQKVLDSCFKHLGSTYFYLGQGEESRIAKLLVNMMLGNTLQILGESLVLGQKAGIPLETILDVIKTSACGSPAIQVKVPVILKGEYPPQFSVKLIKKDLDLAEGLAKKLNSPIPMTSLTRQSLASAVSKGYENKDSSVLVKILEEFTGISRK